MTSTTDASSGKGVKTLAIRLDDERHGQLTLIAQLLSSTVTDEIRQAIDAHIVNVKSAPDFADRAESALADIEREAAARRDAVNTLFGQPDTAAPADATPARKQRGRATGSASS